MATQQAAVPLASLSPSATAGAQGVDVGSVGNSNGKPMNYKWLMGGVVLAAAAWLLLYATKPEFIQKVDSAGRPTGEIDNMAMGLWIFLAFLIGAFAGSQQ